MPTTTCYGDWTPVDHWVETEERAPRAARLAGVDPRLVRIGAVAAAGLLLIPIALALRSDPADGVARRCRHDDDGGDHLAAGRWRRRPRPSPCRRLP